MRRDATRCDAVVVVIERDDRRRGWMREATVDVRARATDANDGVDRRRAGGVDDARGGRATRRSRARNAGGYIDRACRWRCPDVSRTDATDSIDFAASDALYELTRLAGMDVRREVHDAVLELCRARVVPTAVAQVLRSLANKAADARESGVRDALAATGG